MPKTMTRREYAISLGLAKPTRGRMGRDALAAIDAARKSGKIIFSDDTPAVKPVKATKPRAERSVPIVKADKDEPVEAPKVDPKTYFGPTPPRRGDRNHDVYESADGIRRTYRDVCNKCGWSIGWCSCAVPHALTPNGAYVPLYPVLTRS